MNYTEAYNAVRFYSAMLGYVFVAGAAITIGIAHLLDKAKGRK